MLLGCGGSPEPRSQAAAAEKELPELEPHRVVTAMRFNEAEIRKCFFRAPSDGGFVRIGFEVDRLGEVHGASVRDSSIENDGVQSCLVERVTALRFGELSQAGKAEWTYVYRLAEPPTKEEDEARAKKKAKRKKKKVEEEVEEVEAGAAIDSGSEGTIDLDRVDQIVQTGYQLYARCYREGFERKNDLEGTVRFRFVIGEDGRMDEVLDGESNLSDRRVLDCIAETFYALRFPAPGNKVRVLYRLQLN
ncbi:MAG TPA: AgmX/PglI C-terminal domain-containing protein [Polyangiaceae bacterium]|nr:AgmX/PglI C-terminal domain-containing protein [Polyangiaceae bacterium]